MEDDTTDGYSRLTGVSVEGLFGRYPVDLDLDDNQELAEPRLRIIFDDNGRGKTTVLRAIHHLLSWSDLDLHLNALAELPVDKVTLTLEESVVSFVRNADDPRSCQVAVETDGEVTSVDYEFGREDPRNRSRIGLDRRSAVAYRQKMSGVCLTPVFISDDRTIHGDDVLNRKANRRIHGGTVPAGGVWTTSGSESGIAFRDPSDELRDLLDHLAQAFLQAAFGARTFTAQEAVYAEVVQRIIRGDVREPGDIGELTRRARQVEDRLRLAASYELVNLSQLESVKSTLSGLRQNAGKRKQIATVLDPFFTTLDADADRLEPVAQRVDLFISTVNRYLSDKRMVFSPSQGIRILPAAGLDQSPLQPSQLSSGERHLLLLFGSSLIAEGRRLILIDEPELSLGIAWKRMLLQSLLDLTREAGTQFLIASHSVEIISPFHDNACELRTSRRLAAP